MLRELFARENAGTVVSLSYDPAGKVDETKPLFRVSVNSPSLPSFVASADNYADAHDIYWHPYGMLNTLQFHGRLLSYAV